MGPNSARKRRGVQSEREGGPTQNQVKRFHLNGEPGQKPFAFAACGRPVRQSEGAVQLDELVTGAFGARVPHL